MMTSKEGKIDDMAKGTRTIEAFLKYVSKKARKVALRKPLFGGFSTAHRFKGKEYRYEYQ